MPDENNNNNGQNEAPKVVGNVTRNDVSLPIVETKITRGKNKNTVYMAPDTSDLNTLIAWLGREQLTKLIVPRINAIAQGWTDEATDESTNQFDFDKYCGFATSFSQRGESKADLIKQRDELVAEMSEYDPSKPEDLAAIGKIVVQIQQLSADIAAKKRERKEKTEGEAAPATN